MESTDSRSDKSEAPEKVCQDEIKECSVCLAEMNELSEAGLDSCKHTFHIDCISVWGKQSSLCPLCKGQFSNILFQGGKIASTPIAAAVDSDDNGESDDSYSLESEEDEDDEEYPCSICGVDDDTIGRRLPCSSFCGSYAHQFCLGPSYEGSTWRCADCTAALNRVRSRARRSIGRVRSNRPHIPVYPSPTSAESLYTYGRTASSGPTCSSTSGDEPSGRGESNLAIHWAEREISLQMQRLKSQTHHVRGSMQSVLSARGAAEVSTSSRDVKPRKTSSSALANEIAREMDNEITDRVRTGYNYVGYLNGVGIKQEEDKTRESESSTPSSSSSEQPTATYKRNKRRKNDMADNISAHTASFYTPMEAATLTSGPFPRSSNKPAASKPPVPLRGGLSGPSTSSSALSFLSAPPPPVFSSLRGTASVPLYTSVLRAGSGGSTSSGSSTLYSSVPALSAVHTSRESVSQKSPQQDPNSAHEHSGMQSRVASFLAPLQQALDANMYQPSLSAATDIPMLSITAMIPKIYSLCTYHDIEFLTGLLDGGILNILNRYIVCLTATDDMITEHSQKTEMLLRVCNWLPIRARHVLFIRNQDGAESGVTASTTKARFCPLIRTFIGLMKKCDTGKQFSDNFRVVMSNIIRRLVTVLHRFPHPKNKLEYVLQNQETTGM